MSQFNNSRRNIILQKLDVPAGEDRIPGWILSAIPTDSDAQTQYLLAETEIDANRTHFDYSLLLKNDKVLSYLELVEDQKIEIGELIRGWNSQTKVEVKSKNAALTSVLLKEQVDYLNEFAWREVYFRGDFFQFVNNAFIQKELKMSKAKLVKLLPEIKKICDSARSLVNKIEHESRTEVFSLIKRAVGPKLFFLIGDDYDAN